MKRLLLLLTTSLLMICSTVVGQVGFSSNDPQLWRFSGLNTYYLNGNVGINVVSPGVKLDVQGDSAATESKEIARFKATDSPTVYFLSLMKDAGDAPDFGGSVNNLVIRASNTYLNLVGESGLFFTTWSGAAWVSRLSITQAGDVNVKETINVSAVTVTNTVTLSTLAAVPATPASGFVTLYACTNGSAKIVCVAKFSDGSTNVFATQP